MNKTTHRRRFLSGVLGTAGLAAAVPFAGRATAQGRVSRSSGNRVRLGLNAYSFNEPLRAGTLTLEDVVHYCAQHGLDGLDATGYYFPGYPKVPDDTFLYGLKRRAFVNGVTISGTGVRNDFAVDNPAARQRDVRMVKDWIEAAAKLGATVVRIFSGLKVPDGGTFERTLEWMVPDMKACVDHGRQHGVIVGLQNHHDFVKTAAETIRIVEAVNSEWFGVVLDIGSLRQDDPYAEIEKLVPYAVTWQLKESVWYGAKEVSTDVSRIKAIIDKAGYRGFLPIETLGPGDPRVKVARFLADVRRVFATAPGPQAGIHLS